MAILKTTFGLVLALAIFGSLHLAAGEANANDAVNPNANPPAKEAEWQTVPTTAVPLPQPKQMLTPGIFDSELYNIVTIPKDGAPVDIGLPHAGKDKSGKEYPAMMLRFMQNSFWIDFNGDGKAQKEETRVINPDGLTDPFFCDLHYEDGTGGQYSFRLKTIVEKEKFAIIRAIARTFDFEGKKIILFDDNGNGKYGEPDKDSIVIGDNPVAFIGKYFNIGDKFYEILVHEGGTTVEIRPAPKLEYGWIDLFEKYKPSQKSESLKIHTLVVSGPQGSFAVDDRTKKIKVPAGAYDFVFGIFERAKETVYLKKGDQTSFTVNADKVATPKWGGEIKANFSVKTDEKGVTVGAPTFYGDGTERYFPEKYGVIPITASVAQVYQDRMKLEKKQPFGSRRFDVLPTGDLAPITFKPYRNSPDDYDVNIDYNSGILGNVDGKQRYHYVPVAKKADDKKAK